jgi:hypothetical protein
MVISPTIFLAPPLVWICPVCCAQDFVGVGIGEKLEQAQSASDATEKMSDLIMLWRITSR